MQTGVQVKGRFMDMTNAALWDELQRNPATQGYTTSRFLTIAPASNGIDHGLVIKNGDQGSMPMHTRHTLVHSNNQYQLWHYDTDGSSVYDQFEDTGQAVDIMTDTLHDMVMEQYPYDTDFAAAIEDALTDMQPGWQVAAFDDTGMETNDIGTGDYMIRATRNGAPSPWKLHILPPGQSGVDGARLTVQAEDGHGDVRTEAFDTVDGAVQWATTLLRDGR